MESLTVYFGVVFIILGFVWFYYCHNSKDQYIDNAYSRMRDLGTGIFIILLGLLMLFRLIKL